MRTAIVSSGFVGRYADKSIAEEKAKELGGEVCYLRLHTIGLEASFGFAVEKDGEIIGCDDYTWI